MFKNFPFNAQALRSTGNQAQSENGLLAIAQKNNPFINNKKEVRNDTPCLF